MPWCAIVICFNSVFWGSGSTATSMTLSVAVTFEWLQRQPGYGADGALKIIVLPSVCLPVDLSTPLNSSTDAS